MEKPLSLLSQAEAKILAELRALRAMRAQAIELSLDATRQRALEAAQNQDCATVLYHEAILMLAADDDDSWEIAREKSEALECHERNFIQAKPIFFNAMRRIDFEIGEAKKGAGLDVTLIKSG